MNSSTISLWLAFLAGLASFLSPCVLSLVPIYIGYLGGRSVGDVTPRSARWFTFLHGLAFVCGFSLVFIFFNIVAASLGLFLGQFQYWLAKIGGLVVILFGVHLTGLYRIPWLDYEKRFHIQGKPRGTFFSSFLLGLVFAAGWTPCIGPILGAILTFSINGGSLVWGVSLGAAYSLGMALPFLAAAIVVGWVTLILKRYTKLMRGVEVTMGVLMILAGILLFFDSLSLINRFFPGYTPPI
jgi:cytochrome c-type biogenesis protein